MTSPIRPLSAAASRRDGGYRTTADTARVGISCLLCPLRRDPAFEPLSDSELTTLAGMKSAHGRAWADETLIPQEDKASARLMTLFSGWAARYRTLPSGERHLLSIILPGETIGLESILFGTSTSSVVALTDVTYCSFRHDQLSLLINHESLGTRALRAEALAHRRTAAKATVIGSHDARSSVVYFLVELHDRLRRRRLIQEGSYKSPLTHRHLAEAAGLTIGHVHRTLRALRQDRLLSFRKGVVELTDMAALRRLGAVPETEHQAEPLL